MLTARSRRHLIFLNELLRLTMHLPGAHRKCGCLIPGLGRRKFRLACWKPLCIEGWVSRFSGTYIDKTHEWGKGFMLCLPPYSWYCHPLPPKGSLHGRPAFLNRLKSRDHDKAYIIYYTCLLLPAPNCICAGECRNRHYHPRPQARYPEQSNKH